jgi:hypothetical protein
MTFVRRTLEQRRAAKRVATSKRKPVFKKPKGRWTFASAVELCAAANLPLHPDTEAHWNTQTARPSWRSMLLLDGRQPKVTQIATGGTSGIQTTPEQKAAISAKMSAASKQRYAADPGSEHWKEAAAIHEVQW